MDILQSVMRKIGEVPPPTARTPQTAATWQMPGFSAKTRIRTSFGDLPIEALRLRDEIRTLGGRILRVAWIDRLLLDQDFLTRHPEAQPIMLRAGAQDSGRPMRDMMVSPGQVLSCDPPNARPRPHAAAEIRGRSGIYRHPEVSITYYRFHCDEPDWIFAEGIPAYVAPPEPAPPEDPNED